MADPYWVDSCTIGYMANGDAALESALAAKRDGGSELLIVPKVQEEVLRGNPFKKLKPDQNMAVPTPEQAAARQAVIDRLKIKLDTQGSADDRRQLFEKQFKFDTRPDVPADKLKPTVVRAIEESDAIILSQVKASANARGVNKPVLITSEGRLVNNADAKLFKVDVINIKPPPGAGGGGGGGTKPTPVAVGNAQAYSGVRKAVGPIAVGVGSAALGLLAAYIRGKIAQAEVEKQIKELEPQMRAKIADKIGERVGIQAAGGTPHAVITVNITTWTGNVFTPDGSDNQQASLPLVTLDSVEIKSAAVAGTAGPTVYEHTTWVDSHTTPVVWSVPVPVPDAVTAGYKKLKKVLDEDLAIWADPATVLEDRRRLETEMNRLRQELTKLLADG